MMGSLPSSAELSKSLDRAPRSTHGSIWSSEIGSVLPLESVLGA